MQELVKRNLRFVISVAKKYQNRGLRAHRPDRRGQRRAPHRGPEVRSRPGRQVHLLRRLVDPAGDPRRAGAPGPHRAGAAQPHRRPLPHRPHRRDAAPGAPARADARGDRRRHRPRRSTWCSRSPRSTPARSGSTRRSIPRATARSSTASSPTSRATPKTQAMDRFLSEEIEQRAPHAAAARRQGAPALLRARRRPGAHARGDRRHARRHPRAGAPAPRPRAQAAPRGRGRPGAGELRGVSRTLPPTVPPRSVPPSRVRPARDGFVAHVGRRSLEAARALADVRTWRPLLAGPDAAARRGLGADRALHRRLHRHRPRRCSPPTSSPAPSRSTSWARWSARRS